MIFVSFPHRPWKPRVTWRQCSPSSPMSRPSWTDSSPTIGKLSKLTWTPWLRCTQTWLALNRYQTTWLACRLDSWIGLETSQLASWRIWICCQELVMWQVKDWKQRECDKERDGRCVPWWVESLCDLEVSWFLMRNIVVLTSSKQLASLISPRITNKVCDFPVRQDNTIQ